MKNRLDAICSLITKDDNLVDIGCDHGYVSIYAAKLGCHNVIASDIHEKALENAKLNIKSENLSEKIQTVVSDGLEKIDVSNLNTILITGMGTSTIIHILSLKEKLENIEKIILQSNNDLKKLRVFMNNLGYSLEEEKLVKEKKHYYTIMKYLKKEQKLESIELELGLYQKDNYEYYAWLEKKYLMILEKIPRTNIKQKNKIQEILTQIQIYKNKG